MAIILDPVNGGGGGGSPLWEVIREITFEAGDLSNISELGTILPNTQYKVDFSFELPSGSGHCPNIGFYRDANVAHTASVDWYEESHRNLVPYNIAWASTYTTAWQRKLVGSSTMESVEGTMYMKLSTLGNQNCFYFWGDYRMTESASNYYLHSSAVQKLVTTYNVTGFNIGGVSNFNGMVVISQCVVGK